MKQKLRAEMLKAETRGCGRIRRAWRVLRATPAQGAVVDAVLGGPVAVPPGKPAKAGDAGCDNVERVLSPGLDALTNAIDAYRDRKKGGSV